MWRGPHTTVQASHFFLILCSFVTEKPPLLIVSGFYKVFKQFHLPVPQFFSVLFFFQTEGMCLGLSTVVRLKCYWESSATALSKGSQCSIRSWVKVEWKVSVTRQGQLGDGSVQCLIGVTCRYWSWLTRHRLLTLPFSVTCG